MPRSKAPATSTGTLNQELLKRLRIAGLITPAKTAVFTREGLRYLLVAPSSHAVGVSDSDLDAIGAYLAANNLEFATDNRNVPVGLFRNTGKHIMHAVSKGELEPIAPALEAAGFITLGNLADSTYDKVRQALEPAFGYAKGSATIQVQRLLRVFGLNFSV